MALDGKDLAIAGGGALAFILGWRRLAGAVWGLGGLYEFDKGHKIAGSIAMAGGASFLLFPDWPASLGESLKSGPSSGKALPPALPPPVEITWPPIQKASYPTLDRALDGGWTMLDVRDIRSAAVAARAKSLTIGDAASLVLQHKGGPYMVFKARVIGGSMQTLYAAQWITQPPSSGPQMAEFGQEHVFVID